VKLLKSGLLLPRKTKDLLVDGAASRVGLKLSGYSVRSHPCPEYRRHGINSTENYWRTMPCCAKNSLRRLLRFQLRPSTSEGDPWNCVSRATPLEQTSYGGDSCNVGALIWHTSQTHQVRTMRFELAAPETQPTKLRYKLGSIVFRRQTYARDDGRGHSTHQTSWDARASPRRTLSHLR
jgi:hypothetical protein